MPAKKAAAKGTRGPARKRAVRDTSRLPTAMAAATAFAVGDIVVGADDPGRVGRVCTVVTAGRSYQIRFADSPICMLTPHAAIVAAPAGTVGPPCTPDC
ncbi:MAG: hypothetical protein HZC37_04815 [Burkholderiales bacterium]|nr:hypothetical protein [Burkholderiales bacterium]